MPWGGRNISSGFTLVVLVNTVFISQLSTVEAST